MFVYAKLDFEIELSGNQTRQISSVFLSDPIRSVEVPLLHKTRPYSISLVTASRIHCKQPILRQLHFLMQDLIIVFLDYLECGSDYFGNN